MSNRRIAHARRDLTTRQWAFQNIQGDAFMVCEQPSTIGELAKALISIDDPPELEETELEQLQDTERALLTKLAEAYPETIDDLLRKAERAVAALLNSIETGDMEEEIKLGKALLSDLQYEIRRGDAH